MAKKATLIAFVAHSGPESFHFDEDAVLLAVGGDLLDYEPMARRFTFYPELIARTAEECREARLNSLLERFFIHEADHEHAVGDVVLNDRRYESVEFRIVQSHGGIQ